jgi:protein subunit release factor B
MGNSGGVKPRQLAVLITRQGAYCRTKHKNYARLITLDMIYKEHHNNKKKKAYHNRNLAARKLVSDAITSFAPSKYRALGDETTSVHARTAAEVLNGKTSARNRSTAYRAAQSY